MSYENKYHELDKRVSKNIMKEFEGKTISHECPSCWGEGFFTINDDKNTEKCNRCSGTGVVKYQY